MANQTNIEENIRIGHLLQNARESHGLTQQDLCKAADLSKNQISAVERGASEVTSTGLSSHAASNCLL